MCCVDRLKSQPNHVIASAAKQSLWITGEGHIALRDCRVAGATRNDGQRWCLADLRRLDRFRPGAACQIEQYRPYRTLPKFD
jgi:hypothetical protein